MFTYDAEARKDLVSSLRARNEELRDMMFGASGIRPMTAEPRPFTRDASALAEFTRNMTEYVDNQLETEIFADITFRQVMSFNTSMSPGDDLYTKHELTANGKAGLIDENGNNVPMLEVGVVPTTRPLYPYGLGYRITRSEILRATTARRPISMEKPRETRRVVEELLDRVFWLGDSQTNLYGILNHTGIPINDATTGTWATATADQIKADILTMINNRTTAVKSTTRQYMLGMPPTQYNRLTQVQVASAISDTIGQWLLSKIPQLVGFFSSPRLIAASADNDNYGILVPVGRQFGYGLMSQDVSTVAGPVASGLTGEDYLMEARIGGFFTQKPLEFEIIEDI